MKLNLIAILSLSLLIISCNKSDLKKPTSVNIEFNTNTSTIATNNINLESSEITIQEFFIRGKRVKGENINFTKHLQSPLNIDLEGNKTIDELFFNIPQGNYTELSVEFENILTTIEPSIIIEGNYKLTSGPIVDVIFEMSQVQEFTLNCDFKNQSDIIILDKNIEQNISIELSPVTWLNSITNSELENAVLTIGNNGNGLGNSTIFLNETNNVSLYNKIVVDMTNGNKAIFK
jgi:hypothetical protein